MSQSAAMQNWLERAFTTPLFRLGREGISLVWILQVVALFVLVSLAARLLKQLLKQKLLTALALSEGRREAIATLASFGLAAMGYVVVVQVMGVDFGSLAVLLGALGVGLGFGLQDLTKNLTSGLTLLMEGKLKVGDLIEFDQTMGTINEISIRATVIRTFQGSEIVVPNAFLTNSPVRNLSYRSTDGRIEVTLTVAHDSDVLEVIEVLLQAAHEETQLNPEPPPKVILSRLDDQGLVFVLWAWTSSIDNSLSIKSALNFGIERHLRERGIAIAHGQLRRGARSQDPDQAEGSPARVEPLRDLLSALPYFQHLHEGQLRQLIESGARRELVRGEALVRQGDDGRGFCFVLRGSIQAIFETELVSRLLFTFGVGQFFGELPLLLHVPYPTTMRAEAPTTLFVVHERGFHQLLESQPAFAEEIARECSHRQEVLKTYEAQLRERGLLTDADMGNTFDWLRRRLTRVFQPKPLPPMIGSPGS